LFLLQLQELSIFHLLQVLTQELALGALAGELGFAVREHDAFPRSLTQLLEHESFKGLGVLQVFIVVVVGEDIQVSRCVFGGFLGT
jgi:hypothetical protein